MNSAYEQLGIEYAILQQRVEELKVKKEMAHEHLEKTDMELGAAELKRDEAKRVLLAASKHITIIHPQDKSEQA